MSSKPIKHLAKETLFVGLALICMFAMVIITSIGSAGLDPAKIFSKGNVANLLINASITLFGIIATIPSGRVDTKQRVNPDGSNGKYLQDFHAYNKIRKLIEPLRSKFSQWHHAQFLKELRDKQVSYLLSFNILQAEDILKLSREQVLQLTTSQAFLIDNETVYFKSLSDRQIFECLRVLNGEVTVHKLPDFYFLYIDGKRKRSFYDQAYYEAQDENLSLTFKIIYKVFIGFVITCIFTGLVVDAVVVEGITPAWVLHTMLLIFTRIFNAVSSTMWGYLIGQESVYTQCYYINGKTQFLEAFYNDNEFVYKSTQEIAQEEYLKERSVPNGERNSNSENSNILDKDDRLD